MSKQMKKTIFGILGGIVLMLLIAYLPPLWFRVMDPRVVQAVSADAARINFAPGQRAVLSQRWGLQTE